MGRKSYPQALDTALRPFGFTREGDDWVRVRGDMWECVNRQSRWLGGVTVNLFQMDLKTDQLYVEIFGPDEPRPFVAQDMRIGKLINGYDRWWTRDDVNGPEEMAQAVVKFGLPWFDRVRTIEEQAVHWYGRDVILPDERQYGQRNLVLALTLWRLGLHDEVRRLAERKPRRTSPEWDIQRMARLREWLATQPDR